MSTPSSTAAKSLHVFLQKIIDYAGLFPPASLGMQAAVTNYARYRELPQCWMLGRFVLPVARLDEFLNAQENLASDPWQLSGILSADVEADLRAVDEFNRKAPGAAIDSLEARVSSLDEIARVHGSSPAGLNIFFEFPPDRADHFLPELRKRGSHAKLRAGGVVESAFPAVMQVAGFIARCAELGVPFKATAGLHHPLRGLRALTPEPGSPKGNMHGFLNLFTASAIAWSAMNAGQPVSRVLLAACLADSNHANWHFGDDALTWSGAEEPVRIDVAAIQSVRSRFAFSFGSCSVEEPVHDLRQLELL